MSVFDGVPVLVDPTIPADAIYIRTNGITVASETVLTRDAGAVRASLARYVANGGVFA